MDVSLNSNRRLRRATSNLNNLSIAPLTSKFPLDSDDSDEYVNAGHSVVPTSYIEGRSAPATPGVLSRNFSSSQLKLSHASTLPKAKSSSNLVMHSANLSMSGIRSHSRQHSRRNTNDSSEWLTRAGAAISSQATDAKGQSWLVSRASSTGLAQLGVSQSQTPHHYTSHGSDELLSSYAEEEYFHSKRSSRTASQVPSRTGSRPASRRGSRSGSRPDIWMSGGAMTPRNIRSNSAAAREREDYFRQRLPEIADVDTVTGVPFITEDPHSMQVFSDEDTSFDDETTDAEVNAMVRQRGFGLGRWIDSLMEWSLFAVAEEEDEAAAAAAALASGAKTTTARSRARFRSSSGKRRRRKMAITPDGTAIVDEEDLEENPFEKSLHGHQDDEAGSDIDEDDEGDDIIARSKTVDLKDGKRGGADSDEKYPVDVYDPVTEGPIEEDALWQDATWFLSVLGKILL